MSTFWKHYRNGVTAFLIVAGVFLIIYFGVIPLYSKITEKVDAIQRKVADREMNGELVLRLPALHQEAERVSMDMQKLNSPINKDEIISLVESIEALARDTGNEITIETQSEGVTVAVRPDPKKTKADQKSKEKEKEVAGLRDQLPSDKFLEIDIKLTGSYRNVVYFLHRLETMPRLTDVLAIQAEPFSEKSGQTQSTPVNRDVFAAPSEEALNVADKEGSSAQEEGRISATLHTLVYINGN